MIDTTFLSQLNRFNIIIRKKVTSSYTGSRRSEAKGHGNIIKDYRMYTPGDDIRRIDWKIFARTDHLYVKQYEEEKNLMSHIIIDKSSSMGFGAPTTKFEYASMIGVGFAFLALKENEKFKLSTFSDDYESLQPRKGMGQLASIVEHLNRVKPKGKTLLDKTLFRYRSELHSKSMITLISDFLMPINEIKEGLRVIAKHEVNVVMVLHPDEINFPIDGDYRLHDSETNSVLKVSISPSMRAEYMKRLKEHMLNVEDECRKLGIKFALGTTDKPVFDLFYEIIEG